MLLLLAFLAWRLVLCCTSCCCPTRLPRLTPLHPRNKAAPNKPAAAAAARRILHGRGTRCLLTALLLCALGTLGSCIYGLTQTHTSIAAGTLGVVHQAEALTSNALAAGDRLQLSLADLANATQALAQQLEAAGPAYTPLTQQPLQQLGSSQEQLSAAAAGLQDALAELRPATLGAMQRAEASYLPLAQSSETLWVLCCATLCRAALCCDALPVDASEQWRCPFMHLNVMAACKARVLPTPCVATAIDA